jgi:teichuronic acid biosynthesis glycosyltransferase TuaG
MIVSSVFNWKRTAEQPWRGITPSSDANGRFIAFLDGDDLWLPEKLEKQVAFSLEKGAAITHSDYRLMDAEAKQLEKVIHAKPELTYGQMLDYNYIGCLTAMYDVEVIGEKVLMPEILKRQDYALWLRIMRRGHKAYAINEVLALYRTGRKSLSSNKLDSAKYNFKLLTEIEGLPKWKAAYHFIRYMLLGLQKYFLS